MNEMLHRAILESHYDLRDFQLHQIRCTGGGLKDVHRVETGDGSYILKRILASFRDLPSVLALHEAQIYLKQRGLPIPAVLPTRDGRLTCEVNGSCWLLYEMAPGAHRDEGQVTPGSAAAAGALVGQVALHLQHWQTDWQGAEPLQVYPVEERLALFETLLRHAERGTDPLDDRCVQALRSRMAAVERMAPVVPRLLAMEKQWVHGDVNAGNIFYNEAEQVTGLIDFDNMRRAPRGFDFVYGLNACFLLDTAERDQYARAYFETVRPAAAEVELWAPLWAYWRACDAWPIDVRYLEPAAYDPAWGIDGPEIYDARVNEITEWLLKFAQ